MKTSLIALLLALTITGCDQVIQRLSKKTSNNPSVAQPETAEKSSPKDVPRGTEIPLKKDERKGDEKPAEHAINRKYPSSPTTNQAQRDEHKKSKGVNQQQEAAAVDSKGKSAIQEKRKADINPTEVDDTYTGTVRRGNVSREY